VLLIHVQRLVVVLAGVARRQVHSAFDGFNTMLSACVSEIIPIYPDSLPLSPRTVTGMHTSRAEAGTTPTRQKSQRGAAHSGSTAAPVDPDNTASISGTGGRGAGSHARSSEETEHVGSGDPPARSLSRTVSQMQVDSSLGGGGAAGTGGKSGSSSRASGGPSGAQASAESRAHSLRGSGSSSTRSGGHK